MLLPRNRTELVFERGFQFIGTQCAPSLAVSQAFLNRGDQSATFVERSKIGRCCRMTAIGFLFRKAVGGCFEPLDRFHYSLSVGHVDRLPTSNRLGYKIVGFVCPSLPIPFVAE